MVSQHLKKKFDQKSVKIIKKLAWNFGQQAISIGGYFRTPLNKSAVKNVTKI